MCYLFVIEALMIREREKCANATELLSLERKGDYIEGYTQRLCC